MFSQFLRYAILATISTCVTFAQIYTYANVSSDGTNLYATGVMDGNGWPGTSYQHTYTVEPSLTSPDWRHSWNYCSHQYPSASYFYVSCEAVLPIIEEGSYSADITETAVCSLAGRFISWTDPIPITARRATTFYQGCYYYGLGCACPQLACTSGTPTCPSGSAVSGATCTPYMGANWLVLTFFGGPPECFPVGIGFTALPPGGPCN
jgi:hypothetical protein